MTLRRLLLTLIAVLLLWPLRQLTWGPALASGLWFPGLAVPEVRLLAAMILAGQVAAVVTIGIRRLTVATAAGTATMALALGLRGGDWGLTDTSPTLRVTSALVAAGLLVSFPVAVSLQAGLVSLTRAWAIWSGAPRMHDGLPALVPIAGVQVVMLALTASPDLTQLLQSGFGSLRTAPAGTLLGPNGPAHPGSGRIVRDAFYSLANWANRWDGTEPVEDQVVELVGQVDGTYRTLPDRSFRFIGGLSSGGLGALNIALHHADLFSLAMSFSGFASASDPAVDPGVFGTDSSYVARNSPAVQVRTVPEAGELYRCCRPETTTSISRHGRDFASELASLGYPYELHMVEGGHDGRAWGAGLGFGLDYLGRVLPRHPAPTPARQ